MRCSDSCYLRSWACDVGCHCRSRWNDRLRCPTHYGIGCHAVSSSCVIDCQRSSFPSHGDCRRSRIPCRGRYRHDPWERNRDGYRPDPPPRRCPGSSYPGSNCLGSSYSGSSCRCAPDRPADAANGCDCSAGLSGLMSCCDAARCHRHCASGSGHHLLACLNACRAARHRLRRERPATAS